MRVRGLQDLQADGARLGLWTSARIVEVDVETGATLGDASPSGADSAGALSFLGDDLLVTRCTLSVVTSGRGGHPAALRRTRSRCAFAPGITRKGEPATMTP